MAATRIVMASSSKCVLFEHSLRQCAPYCVNLRRPWKGGPDIAGPAASVDRAAFDTHGDTSGIEIPQCSSLLAHRVCYRLGGNTAAGSAPPRFRTIQVCPKDRRGASEGS